MRTYPIMLDLTRRLAVVVGAGAVGLRKAAALREAGAQVRLVAPQIDAGADLGGLEVIREPYRKELLDGAFLVLACTDDRELNACIAREAREAGALVNVADTPEECDFYLSATLCDGDVVVAVGTGGAVPALSAWLKRRLADALPERLGEFAAALEELRAELGATVPDSRRRMAVMKQLVTDQTHGEFLARGRGALRAKLAELLDS
jgi:siroheme synthase-like protein